MVTWTEEEWIWRMIEWLEELIKAGRRGARPEGGSIPLGLKAR